MALPSRTSCTFRGDLAESLDMAAYEFHHISSNFGPLTYHVPLTLHGITFEIPTEAIRLSRNVG